MNKLLIFNLLLLSWSSCQKFGRFPNVEVVGHACAGLDVERNPFPVNTQEAIDFGLSLGLQHIEVDLQLTADNHWVLFHDDFLQRKTNFSGSVRQFSLSELQSVRYQGFPSIGIPALDEIDFSACQQVFLDIRHYDPSANYSLIAPEFMHAEILNLISRYPSTTFTVVCRSAAVLNHFQSFEVNICHEVADYNALINSSASNGFNFFAIRNSNITKEEVLMAQNSGYKLLLYGVKSHEGNKAAMRKNPNFVMSDAITSAIQLTK